MKQFDIPSFYKSPIISKVKAHRKAKDPRKKDFTPTLLDFGKIKFYIARHFGFCYGVENAIEISYKALYDNPNKRIFLLSQMIHNPFVNMDLNDNGIRFIQDTNGKQLIPWSELTKDDIVIIPAFGTTLETEEKLKSIGVDIETYNTTCPFVEKVWNRSEKLGDESHTIIIHGVQNHEETRATFSHSANNAPALIVKDIAETRILADYLLGRKSTEEFNDFFSNKMSVGFNPVNDLNKIGVVNQTTMLASETQEITDLLRDTMIQKFGEANIREHIADTRDTLCYATNDNQSATYGLLEKEADYAIVIGGYNSSNTTHLVELLERKFDTFFIQSETDIQSLLTINSFNIHSKKMEEKYVQLKNDENATIIITSGASCPDSIVDAVIQKIIKLSDSNLSIEATIDALILQE